MAKFEHLMQGKYGRVPEAHLYDAEYFLISAEHDDVRALFRTLPGVTGVEYRKLPSVWYGRALIENWVLFVDSENIPVQIRVPHHHWLILRGDWFSVLNDETFRNWYIPRINIEDIS